jgi:hypothetical protein
MTDNTMAKSKRTNNDPRHYAEKRLSKHESHIKPGLHKILYYMWRFLIDTRAAA